MKAVLSFFAVAIIAIACTNNDQSASEDVVRKEDSIRYAELLGKERDSANFTSIQWLDSVSQNKGKVKEGAVLDVSWRFKNVGDKPLVIVSASASCGCTVAEKPEQPIQPGEEGVIRAKFDSKSRIGHQNKTVTVRANTSENVYDLNFSVDVEAK
jgi:hypothetical protein